MVFCGIVAPTANHFNLSQSEPAFVTGYPSVPVSTCISHAHMWHNYHMVLFFNIMSLWPCDTYIMYLQITSSLRVIELPDTDHFTDLHIAWLPRSLKWAQPLTHQHAILILLDPPPIHWDIKSALTVLHTIYPALNDPCYELNNELADALQFTTTFYVTKVGMDYGVAYLFSKWVAEDGNILYCRKSGDC